VADDRDADLRVPEGVSSALVVGALVAMITRPLLWIISIGTIGAVVGGAEVLVARAGVPIAVAVIIEGGLLLAGVVAAVLAAFAVRTGDPRAVQAAELLGVVYVVATGWYLLSIVLWEVLFVIDTGFSPGTLVFTLLPLGINTYLLVLALRVVRSCRSVLRPSTPESAGAAE
jgi:hypothetical protein